MSITLTTFPAAVLYIWIRSTSDCRKHRCPQRRTFPHFQLHPDLEIHNICNHFLPERALETRHRKSSSVQSPRLLATSRESLSPNATPSSTACVISSLVGIHGHSDKHCPRSGLLCGERFPSDTADRRHGFLQGGGCSPAPLWSPLFSESLPSTTYYRRPLSIHPIR